MNASACIGRAERVLRVTAFQMDAIIGHSSSRVMADDVDWLMPGELVKIQVFSCSNNYPTGLFVFRWVINVENLGIHVRDCDAYEIELSAFKPSLEMLGLSGVQK
jgi:hypothetical protein